MHNIIRYYYKNRIKVWAIVLGIIFIVVIIQVLDDIVAKNQEDYNKISNQEDQEDLYKSESYSTISEGRVNVTQSNQNGELIEKFFNYCINNQTEQAYQMLASDTKNVLYKDVKSFKEFYCNEKFNGNKTFSFQYWSKSEEKYIYQVIIYEDALSTGKKNDNYIEDYVTVVNENNEIKLNINSFIKIEKINKENSNDKILIEAAEVEKYMDYQVYTIRVKNLTENRVLLDSREKDNTTYLEDNNGNKFKAYLYENIQNDLIINAEEEKRIKIKFNYANRAGAKVISINFDDIVFDENNIEGLKVQI